MPLNSIESVFDGGGRGRPDDDGQSRSVSGRPVRPEVPDSAARAVVGGYVGADRLTGELEDCVGRLLQIAGSEPLIVSDQIGAAAAAGERLRPVLVLSAAHCASRDLAALLAERAVRAGVVVELLHLASVVHNDVLDESEAAAGPGAGAVSVAREGHLRAVLAGDYLLAQALAAASALGRSEAAIAARTYIRLCEGQAHELVALFDAYRVQDTYFSGIAARCGALFESSFRLGAMSGGLGLKPTAALAEYGMALGIAYQLREDALAFAERPASVLAADEHRSSKGIAEGVYTLPVLLALREQPYLAKLLRDPDRIAAAREAAALVRETGAVEATMLEARRYTVQAIDSLSAAAPRVNATAIDMLVELAETLIPVAGGTGSASPVELVTRPTVPYLQRVA